jgi:hypothetical protein
MPDRTENDRPGPAIIRTVAGRELGDVVFDLAEVALDSLLDEGVLKDLPTVGILAKLARAQQSIAEKLFLRKLLRFLAELQSVSPEERAKLLERHPDGSDQQRDLAA